MSHAFLSSASDRRPARHPPEVLCWRGGVERGGLAERILVIADRQIGMAAPQSSSGTPGERLGVVYPVRNRRCGSRRGPADAPLSRWSAEMLKRWTPRLIRTTAGSNRRERMLAAGSGSENASKDDRIPVTVDRSCDRRLERAERVSRESVLGNCLRSTRSRTV